MTRQITEADIAQLVDTFYDRVRADEILGPIFKNVVHDWPEHLETLTAFWSSITLGTGRYKGRPMPVHLRHAPAMTRENFTRWLSLWQQTTADLFGPEAAAIFQEKAARIAESLQLGIQFHREREAG
jgi:hemoglobin